MSKRTPRYQPLGKALPKSPRVDFSKFAALAAAGYSAKQNADGTWDLFDVPCFAEMQEGTRRAKGKWNPDLTGEAGRAWMQAAVDHAAFKLREDGYRGPVHQRHHDEQTEYIGKFMPRRVGRTRYEGREVWAVFADIQNVLPEKYELIKSGALSFASPEIHDWDIPELNSLAMMPDEVPFFRFRNIEVAQELRYAEDPVMCDGPAVALRASETGAMVLFKLNLDGGKEAATKDDEEKPKPKANEEGGETPAENAAPPAAEAQAEPGDAEGEEGGGNAKKDRLAKIEAQLSAIMQVMGIVAGQQTPQEEPMQTDDKSGAGRSPVEQQAPAPGAPVRLAAQNAEDVAALKAEMAAMKAEMGKSAAETAQLKDGLAKREAEDKVKAMFAKAKADLEAVNVPLGKETEAALLKAASAGQEMLDGFVTALKAGAPADPPASLSGYDARGGAPREQNEEAKAAIAKFAAKGPDAAEKAAKFSALYDQWAGRQPLSRERFIEMSFLGEKRVKTEGGGYIVEYGKR